jgi:hypothetical protein
MATIDDVLSVLGNIEKHLRGNNGGNSTYPYSPSNRSMESDEERRERELKHQDLLDARLEGRYDRALELEKKIYEESNKLFEEKDKILREQYNKESEFTKKLRKEYKVLMSDDLNETIKNLKEKLGRTRKDDKKAEIQALIDKFEKLLKIQEEVNENQHKMLLNSREFERSTFGRNKFTELSKTVSEFSDKMVKAYKSIRNFVEPWAKADDAASKFTKTLGGTKAAMDRLRKDTLDSVATGIGVKFNMSTEELLKAQQDYLKGVGRNISIDDNSRESMAAIAKISQDAGVDGLGFAAQLENFGVSMEETGNHMGRMFAEASKSGISFQKYSDNVVKNMKLAQNYTFKNGIKGLESMAKKATALKMDMQQVANLADKVSTVEGALETSAKLQVLGGPFASMSDPMGMLYEGLTDMEGLQDRIVSMVGGLGTFNKKTGEVEVSAFNKQRIRAAAEAMGMDYSQLMESVNAQAKRGEIKKQIGASATASKFDDDMKELIMNTGVIKDGKVGVNINGKFKTLDDIKEGDREILQQQTQTESQDIKQIAMDLRSLVDKEQGLKKQADAIQAEIASPMGNLLKWVHGIFDLTVVSVGILGAIKAMQAIGAVGNAGSSIMDMFGRRGRGGMFNIFRRGLGRTGKRALIKAFGRKGATNILGRMGTSSLATTARSTMTNLGSKIASSGLGRMATTTVAKKATTSVVTSAANSAGGASASVFGRGVGRAGTRGLIKMFGKNGATKLLGGGGMMAGGGALLAAGMIGNHFTDKAVAEGRMEKGGTGHHLAKGASGAVTGVGAGLMGAGALAALGATGVGLPLAAVAAIGGAIIGGGVGLYKAAKAKNEKIVDEQLKEMGLQRKGDYRRGQLKKLDKALRTGEMSDRLRRKLIQKGDIELVKAIDKKKEEIEVKKEEKEEKKAEKGVKNKFKINKAELYIGVANFSGGNSPFNLLGDGSIDIIKAGILGPINTIKGIKEKGVSNIVKKDDSKEKEINTQTINKPNTFDININGTLKLVGDKGSSVDIIKEISQNEQLKREIAAMIGKQIDVLNRGNDYRSNYKIIG